MSEQTIPRGTAGILAILQVMAGMVRAGSLNYIVTGMALALTPRQVNGWLRDRWQYEDKNGQRGIFQSIRGVDQGPQFLGNCADAAVLAGAILCAYRQRNFADRTMVELMAIRFPDSQEFSHVAIRCNDEHGVFWIDPTAPANANYDECECLPVHVAMGF